MYSKLTKLACAIIVMSLAAASETTAQRPWPSFICGINCLICGPDEWGRQGWPASPYGAYAIRCFQGIACSEHCVSIGPRAVAEVQETDLVARIRGAAPEELPALIEHYGSRLMLHKARRLLAIQGNDCSTDTVDSVVFLSTERTRALVRLGVGPFPQNRKLKRAEL